LTVLGFAEVVTVVELLADVPVPVNETDCGLPGALSVTVRVPSRVPVVVGLNVTETVQFAPVLSDDGLNGQVLVCAKSPVVPIAVIVKGAVPLLVMVTVCAVLVVPTDWLAKVRVVGLKLIPGVPVPVPVKLTD
jgi:hypothetical protein